MANELNDGFQAYTAKDWRERDGAWCFDRRQCSHPTRAALHVGGSNLTVRANCCHPPVVGLRKGSHVKWATTKAKHDGRQPT